MRSIFPLMTLAIVSVAGASTSETIVKNDADPTNHPYMQFAVAGDCTDAGDCAIVFPAITTSRTLVLHTSCMFSLATPGLGYVTLGEQSTNPKNFLQAIAYGTTGGYTQYGINADTYLFYTDGQMPRIDVYSTNAPVTGLVCTISGYYY